MELIDLDESTYIPIINTPFSSGAYGAGPYGSILPGYLAINAIRLGPFGSNEKWLIFSIIPSVQGSVAKSTFTAYRNVVDPSAVVATSQNGNQDDIWVRELTLDRGDLIWGVWYGADAGSRATLRVTGKKQIGH